MHCYSCSMADASHAAATLEIVKHRWSWIYAHLYSGIQTFALTSHTYTQFLFNRPFFPELLPVRLLQVRPVQKKSKILGTVVEELLQAGCPSCRQANSVKALKDDSVHWPSTEVGNGSLGHRSPGHPGQRLISAGSGNANRLRLFYL